MKVLLVNGSPHAEGNTYVALNEMIKVFEQEGVEITLPKLETRIFAAVSPAGPVQRRASAYLMTQ